VIVIFEQELIRKTLSRLGSINWPMAENYCMSFFRDRLCERREKGKMEELEAEEIPLLPLLPPQLPQPSLPPPPSLGLPESASLQSVLPPPPVCHRDSDPLLTPLPESFTEDEQDKFLSELLQHIQESSHGASDEAFCVDQLRLLDYIRIDARSSDSGISYTVDVLLNSDEEIL
jgi:hypothetical protein